MSKESKEMLAILQNLQNAQNGISDKTIVNETTEAPVQLANANSQEMYNILKRLENATNNVATTIAEDTKTDPVSAVGTMQNSTISMGSYNITMEKRVLIENFRKTFYDISDANGNVIYEDIALFETAMSILKSLVTESTQKVKRIIELDGRYTSYLTEAATHKHRATKLLNESRRDVYSAKQSAAMSKAASIKKQIKSLI